MIDFSTEQLIALRDLPARLPRRNDRRIHLSTLYRWISQGARGRTLESVRLGGITYTSVEAIERFMAPDESMPGGDQAAALKAMREAEALGVRR